MAEQTVKEKKPCKNARFGPLRAYGFTTALPAAFHPFTPSAITLTFPYPASTARRAATWEAIQCGSAQ